MIRRLRLRLSLLRARLSVALAGFIQRRLNKALRWICENRTGHAYRFIIRDFGPLGTFAWMYCPRCHWSGEMHFLGRWGFP